MAGKSFHLEIITPQCVMFKGEVASFNAPGTSGGFQVLFNHAPFLSSLDIGEVKIIDSSGTESKYAISGGFAEVRNNQAVLLADTAERINEIDMERAKAARDRARRLILERKPNTDIERAKFALHRALNRLKLAGVAKGLNSG